jgi:hypothetical protein
VVLQFFDTRPYYNTFYNTLLLGDIMRDTGVLGAGTHMHQGFFQTNNIAAYTDNSLSNATIGINDFTRNDYNIHGRETGQIMYGTHSGQFIIPDSESAASGWCLSLNEKPPHQLFVTYFVLLPVSATSYQAYVASRHPSVKLVQKLGLRW